MLWMVKGPELVETSLADVNSKLTSLKLEQENVIKSFASKPVRVNMTLQPNIEPLVMPSWRYRIEPLASGGGVRLTIPNHRTTGSTLCLVVFLLIWCGVGGFMSSKALEMTSSALIIGPIVVTSIGALLMGSVLLYWMFGEETITITPAMCTYHWEALCIHRTKNYDIHQMGPLIVHTTVSRSNTDDNHRGDERQQRIAFQYGGSLVQMGYLLLELEVIPFYNDLLQCVPQNLIPPTVRQQRPHVEPVYMAQPLATSKDQEPLV
ncbi:hypothetical protein DYB38_002423 [Aphanomyces astaci]|uniref:Uncharacterized protein n=1 Tax=Aphanomyces astaci TaxID=112090 RepID=A0A397DCE4_APHAT|nr:hypothetical protein DYB38_002423 [Aphanomyces astaci]